MSEALLRKGKLFFFFLFLLLLDGATKYSTHLVLPTMGFWGNGGVTIFRDFFGISLSLDYVQNRGAAWGMLASMPHLLFFSRVVIVVILIIYAFFFNEEKNRQIPLFFIFTGAVGNILDGCFYGYVVDMIHFYFGRYSCPVFNLADVMISLGICWLFLLSFCPNQRKKIHA